MNPVLGTVIVLVIVLISSILHEIMHGFVAYKLGDNTAKYEGRLTLNPLKHIDPFMSILVPVLLYISHGPIIGGAKPVPVNTRNLKGREWGMALVALAGPLTNIVLAFVAFVIATVTGVFSISNGIAMYSVNNIAAEIFLDVIVINLSLALFNLIPIPPLDGSRLVYAIAPDGVRSIMEWIEQYGITFVIIVVWVFSSQIHLVISTVLVWLLDVFANIVSIFM